MNNQFLFAVMAGSTLVMAVLVYVYAISIPMTTIPKFRKRMALMVLSATFAGGCMAFAMAAFATANN